MTVNNTFPMSHNRSMISSKIRAAFIAPCLGTGGADMLMARLVQHSQNVEWVGLALRDPLTREMAINASRMWPSNVPIYNHNKDWQYDFVNHTPISFADSIIHACKNADIVVTWCIKDLAANFDTIDLPVIEYAQNSDKYAREVVVSNKLITTHRAACSYAAAKVFDSDVTVIYNGIDFNRCAPAVGRKAQRQAWAIPEDAKVVLYMGRLVQEKHPEDLIRVITELTDDYVGIYVGNGLMRDQLYEMAQSFCPGRIAFVKPEYHVGDFLAAADCFLLPSDFEGHPLALMEAMIAGVPCVYTNMDVMRELHDTYGPMGQMIPKGAKTLELAEAVANHQSDEAMAYRANARNVVWNNFNISTIVEQWEHYITDCLFDFYKKRKFSLIYPAQTRKPLEYPQ